MKIEAFRPLRKNSLVGFVTIALASGLRLFDVAIHCSNGRYWAMPASKPRLDRDGRHMIDPATKKPAWDQVVGFVTKERRDKFSEQVIAALRRDFPDALRQDDTR